jgi:hypothetical protein
VFKARYFSSPKKLSKSAFFYVLKVVPLASASFSPNPQTPSLLSTQGFDGANREVCLVAAKIGGVQIPLKIK